MSTEDDITTTIPDSIGENVEIHDSSTPEALFFTTRSKIELALRDYQDGVLARRRWVNPAVTSATFLSVLIVADFSEFLGLSGDFWRSMFFFGLFLSILWLIKSIYDLVNNRNKANIEYVIERLEVEN